MSKENYKKTAIRMPQKMWDELIQLTDEMGYTANAFMVMCVSERMQLERQKKQLMSPEAVAKVINSLNPDVVEVLKNAKSGDKSSN